MEETIKIALGEITERDREEIRLGAQALRNGETPAEGWSEMRRWGWNQAGLGAWLRSLAEDLES